MNSKIDWQQFLIGVIGTAIGVALTFIVSGMLERRNQAQAQRLTAIMVIHDIDETIDQLKSWKETEERNGKEMLRFLKETQNWDKMPYDSLGKLTELLVDGYSDYRIDTSKEKIFNSDLDSWQNLGNMNFLDNVQSFYHQRGGFLEILNTANQWRKPIPHEEYMQLIMKTGLVTEEDFAAALRPFLKKKLSQNQVVYYINSASSRINYLTQFINHWLTLNNENKFLMGITDQELKDYISHISNNGISIGRRKLLGQWQLALEDGNVEYDFHADKSYLFTSRQESFSRDIYWSGKLKLSFSYNGTWELQGDSLILFPSFNTSDLELDTSELVVDKDKLDSLAVWVDNYREGGLKYFKDMASREKRVSYKARLDSSKDKMEWTSAEGEVRYLKRQEQ